MADTKPTLDLGDLLYEEIRQEVIDAADAWLDCTAKGLGSHREFKLAEAVKRLRQSSQGDRVDPIHQVREAMTKDEAEELLWLDMLEFCGQIAPEEFVRLTVLREKFRHQGVAR